MRNPEARLDDILAATADAARLVALGRSRFGSDALLIRAAKNIVAEIGEAAKALDDSTLATIPTVPWRAVKGMRNKVVHDYVDVDIDLLWDTLERALPALEQAIRARQA